MLDLRCILMSGGSGIFCLQSDEDSSTVQNWYKLTNGEALLILEQHYVMPNQPTGQKKTHHFTGSYEIKKKNAAALTFCYIQIEEVAVEDGLHHPSNDGDHVKETLKVEPPYPVDEVEGSVESQEEQVMGGDGLGLTSLADHEELGQDGHRLQVDGERPQNLSRTKTTQCWWKNNRTWMSREAN